MLALPSGMVHSNRQLLELVEIVKPEIRQLILYANKVSGKTVKVDKTELKALLLKSMCFVKILS